MTTNRLGLEQEGRMSDDELKRIADDDHVQCGDASAMALELLAYREASKNAIYLEYTGGGDWYGYDFVDENKEPVPVPDNAAFYLSPPIQAVTVPDEMTPEMMRAVQLKSELGAYAASNLSGAYDLFSEFWYVACVEAKKCHK